ncbi:MAG TPA: DUF6456 domain-containing protein, partial [Alphaproteobacteria bacterium]|nr:DUF6456 domain-containing protein [Alphaproteobacteria bacterium]
FRRAQNGADYGPPERWQHSGRALELTESAGVLAARATEEHIVDFMVMRRMLSAEQSTAAFKFKLDFQRAGLEACVTSSYNPNGADNRDFSRSKRERGDFEEAAYQRWRNAAQELGNRISDVVISTVCHDLLPMPGDVHLLQIGLDRLIDWYGLPKEAR